jgi:hypothetical protein
MGKIPLTYEFYNRPQPQQRRHLRGRVMPRTGKQMIVHPRSTSS